MAEQIAAPKQEQDQGGNTANLTKRLTTLDPDKLYRMHSALDRAGEIVFYAIEEIGKAEGLNSYTQQLSG